MALLRTSFFVLLYGISGVCVLSIAVVIKWGLERLLGPAVPDFSTANVLLSLVSMLLACFVAAAGCFLVFPAIGIVTHLRTILQVKGKQRHLLTPDAIAPPYLPSSEAIQRHFDATSESSTQERQAWRVYCNRLCDNAEKLPPPYQAKYAEVFKDSWAELQPSVREVVEGAHELLKGIPVEMEFEKDLVKIRIEQDQLKFLTATILENVLKYGSTDKNIRISCKKHPSEAELKFTVASTSIPYVPGGGILRQDEEARDLSGPSGGLPSTIPALRQYVESWGGLLTVSDSGSSTSWKLELPCAI